MDNPIELLKSKIKELEEELQDFKTTLRVMESLEVKTINDLPKSLLTFSDIPQKTTLRNWVLKIIKECSSNISTSDVISMYMEIKGIDRKAASNSVCPTLSNLAKDGELLKIPIPNGNGSYWKIKE